MPTDGVVHSYLQLKVRLVGVLGDYAMVLHFGSTFVTQVTNVTGGVNDSYFEALIQ
jgi:hypothetical protein